MDNGVLIRKIEKGVATLTLNRPEKRNALNGDLLEALKSTFEELASDADARAIVLRGHGVCFSSGIDLNYLAGLAAVDEKLLGGQVRVSAHKIQGVLNAIEDIEKPVIAAIHGFCGGLALELAMACDFRLAAASATFGVPEILLGLIPDCGGTTRLVRTLGIARAKELVMLGEMIDAHQAEKFGIVTRVFENDAFEAEARKFADKMLDRPALALGLAKRLIDIGANTDRNTFMDLEAAFQSLLITARDFPQNFTEGIGKIKAMKK